MKKNISLIIFLILFCLLINGCGGSDGPTTTPTNTPTPTSTNTPNPTGYHVYYGQLHNHTSFSDGKGTPAQAYQYARDHAKLDFFGLADHSYLLSPEKWTETIKQANNYNKDNQFITFWGFEATSLLYGHVSVINPSDYCSQFTGKFTFGQLVNWISSHDCVAFFNHPGDYNKLKSEFEHFSTTPNSKFVGIELWNKSNGFTRYYYNDGYYSNDGNKSYYDEANSRGWKIGAAGSGDNHKATWGTDTDYRLAVLSTAKTRAAIYDSLQNRRFYSTLDKNLVMSFEINGAPMGSVINAGTYNMAIKLSDGNSETFTEVKLFKNGAVQKTWTPGSANPTISESLTGSTGNYFYIKVKQADGDEAISSPVFIK